MNLKNMNQIQPTEPIEQFSEEEARQLIQLGMRQFDQYALSSEPDQLQAAFSSFDKALALIPKSHPLRPILLNNVSISLRERHPIITNEHLIRKSIQLLDDCISLKGLDREEYLNGLTNQGVAYRRLYTHSHDIHDLNTSLQFHKMAFDQVPADSLSRPIILSNYGNALRQRFEVVGDLIDLDRAIEVHTIAVSLYPKQGEKASTLNQTLGVSLLKRYEVTKQKKDLDTAINHFKSSVGTAHPTSELYLPCQLYLACALVRRFESDLQGPALDEAFRILEVIVNPNDLTTDLRASYLSSLNIALRLRFNQTGNIYDLRQTVNTLRQLVPLSPVGSADYLGNLSDLSIMLSQLYSYTQQEELLDEAQRGFVIAISLSDNDPSFAARCHQNLANLLKIKYERIGDPSIVNEAIQHRQTAITLTPAGSTELTGRIAALGQDQIDLCTIIPNDTLYKTAIENLRRASLLPSPTEVDRAGILATLSSALIGHEKFLPNSELVQEAITAARTATEISMGLSNDAEFNFASRWACLAAYQHDWQQAAVAFKHALETRDRLYEIQITPTYKATCLQPFPDLHPYAAYVFAKIGDLESSLLSLEKGRARLLSDSLALVTHDIESLTAIDPSLSADVSRTSEYLRFLYSQQLLPISIRNHPKLEEEILATMKHWRDLLGRVRQLPGFEQFRQPGSIADVILASSIKPLVYIAATPIEGIAIIVQPGFVVEAIFLPNLSISALGIQFENMTRQFSLDGNYHAGIDNLSRWLWDIAMGSITKHLNSRGISECVLIPYGLLGVLPLHAAWKPSSEEGSKRVYALDVLTFSYAPSAHALVTTNPSRNRSLKSIFFVEDPTCTLLYTAMESASVLNYFSEKDLLGGYAATKQAVLNRIGGHNVIHFSGHAFFDPSIPLDSGFIVANNEQLKLRDIPQLSMSDARLVVLSACETGLIGAHLLDEVIGFPGAFMGLGVPTIVSSIWSIDDESTAILMAEFYHNLIALGLPIDRALQQAQIALRDGYLSSSDFSHPYYWAPFLVTGY